MLKLKLQYFGHLMWQTDSSERPWCWERLKAGREGDDRGWDGLMASPTQCTWVWASSRSWWWTGQPGVLQFMGSQRVRHDWATELNWTNLTAIQGTLKNLLQHNLKASILWHSIFMVQLSYPYMTSGKTIALIIWTFVSNVMFLLFTTLSRFVIAFPRTKRLLISWLQSPHDPQWFWSQENKIRFHFFPIYLPWSDGTRCHDLFNVEF